MNQLFSTIKVLFLALVLSFGLSYALAAWAPPTATPPGDNADAPINIGSELQTKIDGDICTRVSGVTKCIQDAGGSDNLGNHTATQALDMAGFNVNNAANLLNTSATAQTKSGGLTVGSLTTGGAVRSSSVYSNILKLGTPGGDSGQSPDYYGIYQESGPWSGAFPDLKIGFHTGIKYDAYYGYGGHRFFTGYDGSGNPVGETMSIGNGDQNVRVTNTLYANDVYSTVANASMSTIANRQFGVGQTWQDMTASRAWNVLYTNSTGRPIQVAITHSQGLMQMFVGATMVGSDQGGNNNTTTFSTFIVPAGSVYWVINSGGPLLRWAELR